MEIPPRPDTPEQLPRTIKHITEMTEEEREAVIGKCEKARASYAECMKGDSYCCKRDICKEMWDGKERKEKEAKERMDTLGKRNEVLEAHARQQEKIFSDYKKDTDKKIEKLASLIGQLMSK